MILNGTASTDDHEIVAWEWTKDAGDDTKAVDMQNTRTPYLQVTFKYSIYIFCTTENNSVFYFLQLSNLQEGIYTFVLKVTDGSAQSSTATVNVFVTAHTNTPPIAVAGGNQVTNACTLLL